MTTFRNEKWVHFIHFNVCEADLKFDAFTAIWLWLQETASNSLCAPTLKYAYKAISYVKHKIVRATCFDGWTQSQMGFLW